MRTAAVLAALVAAVAAPAVAGNEGGLRRRLADPETEGDVVSLLQDEASLRVIPGVDGGACGLDHVTCCTVNSSSACNFDDMIPQETTMVYPGGETSCIFGDPFGFQVDPGSYTDKLIFMLQGGGCCWNKLSTDLHLCTARAWPLPSIGVFDRARKDNPFRTWTYLTIPYCSGDAHGGNVTRPYDSFGRTVTQRGLYNVQATIDWVKQQQAEGKLPAVFSDIVFMGCSAGTLGLQIWANELLHQLNFDRASIVADSYAGVFPPGSVEQIIPGFGICSWLPSALQDSCNAKTMSLQDITTYNMGKVYEAFPNVAFSFVQGKTDIIQRAFYDAINFLGVSSEAEEETARDGLRKTFFISKSDFYDGVNTIFEQYAPYPSFVNFLVQSEEHCYANRPTFFSTKTTGSFGLFGASLVDFLGSEPVEQGKSISSECNGKELDSDHWKGYKYCDSALVGKTFTPSS